MSAAMVFAASYFSVFALGFQSLNVNQGRYFWASTTSIVICTGSLGLFRALPTGGLLEIAAYYVGCNLGILTSMWSHPRLKSWWDARKTPDRKFVPGSNPLPTSPKPAPPPNPPRKP